MACPHEHTKLVDGTFAIKCIDCDRTWNAVDERGMPDYTLKMVPAVPGRETRHDRFVMPRLDKLVPLKLSPIKKPT
jgi:hypothetical protein